MLPKSILDLYAMEEERKPAAKRAQTNDKKGYTLPALVRASVAEAHRIASTLCGARTHDHAIKSRALYQLS